MRIRRALPVLVLILGLLVLGIPRTGAEPLSQQPGLGITAHAGFGDDSSYVMNEWFPVRVLLTNPAGAPSMRVRVEVDSPGLNNKADSSYAREVDLPSPSRKEVTLYVATRAGTSFVSSFNLRLVQGDTVIASKSVTASALEQGNDTIVGVLSSDASLLNVLRGERMGHVPAFFTNSGYYPGPVPTGQPNNTPPPGARITVAHITTTDIPSLSAALNSLAAIVLDDADTSTLTQEQQESLTAWIARGGMLIVAARAGGADLSQPIADLLPVQINGTCSLDSLQGLASLVSSPITLTAPVLATNSIPRTGWADRSRLLASQDGVPLAAMRDVGEGHVAYLALSPGLSPLKTWDGLVPLFKRLMVEHRLGSTFSAIGAWVGPSSYSYSGSGYSSSSITWGAYSSGQIFATNGGGLFDLPVLNLPEPLGIAVFLLIYIVLIGPVNFIVLRRMRRAELAWITIPAFVLVFSVGAYLIGYQSKGGDLILIRSSAVHSAPGVQQADAKQFAGVFSPLRSNLKMTVSADSAVAELNPDEYGGSNDNNPVRVVGGGGGSTTLDNVIINTGSIKSFVAEDTVKADPPLEADLRLADNLIVGTLRNRSNGGLQDVALIRGDAIQYIGYMAAGSTTQVKLTVSSRAFDNSSSTSILPAPSGVSAFTSSGYSGGNAASSEQRKYDRKVQLFNVALKPLLTDEPPTDMDVLAIAWGANSPVNVNVEGHIARTEDLNLWTSRLPVAAAADQPSSLKAGSVPFWTYLPTTDPAWYPQLSSSSVNLDPYADMQFQLPTGTEPERLALTTSWPLPNGVDLLAYNVRTGQWDRLIDTQGNGSQTSTASLMLPNPTDYTGPAGDVTIRLLSKSGKTSVPLSTFEMALN